MRIALDAMGSDNAPSPDVQGAIRAVRRFGHEIILVGREERIAQELAAHDTQGLPLRIVHAEQVVEMQDHPSDAVRRKPDASIVVGMGLVQRKEADAFVSAGNSGAVLASALVGAGRVGRIKGIQRPAISTVFPTLHGICLVLDIGANADCRPEWLAQFALMGSVYAEKVMGIAEPRVALLSNGEEETKGNAIVQAAHPLLKQLPIRFTGNVEGKDVPQGLADVIVADGFVGNIAIKTAEGVASLILSLLRAEIKARPLSMLGGFLAKSAFQAAGKRLDYREYGGAPLLGVNGVVIIAHGRSDASAIENAIRVAVQSVETRVVQTIQGSVEATLGTDIATAPETDNA